MQAQRTGSTTAVLLPCGGAEHRHEVWYFISNLQCHAAAGAAAAFLHVQTLGHVERDAHAGLSRRWDFSMPPTFQVPLDKKRALQASIILLSCAPA